MSGQLCGKACGFGECNEAGMELLSFLGLNALTVCNTWFEKKAVFKQSWQHPSTKRWHAIDFIIARQRERRFCRDCRVVPSADCGTDHRMVCLSYRLAGLRFPRRGTLLPRRRFDVSLLQSSPGMSPDQREVVTN